MHKIIARWRVLVAVSLTAASLAGCNDGGTQPTAAPPPQDGISFSAFATQAFSNSANSTPVSVDLTFKYDADNNPMAFDELIASGRFGQ